MTWDVIAGLIAIATSTLTFVGAMIVVRSNLADSSMKIHRIERDMDMAEFYHRPFDSDGRPLRHN